MIDRSAPSVNVSVQGQSKDFDYEKFGRATVDAMIAAGIGFKCDDREFARYAKDRKIIKVKSDGTEENLFNSKNNESSIWEKIPAGLSIVSWNGAFGFDIILFNERGTPRWTSR